jgi:chemotaxis methyl-accepting protein methylase
MTIVDAGSEALVAQLAAAVNRRVGLKPGDVARKIAACLARVDWAERPAYAERVISALPRDRAWADLVERMLVHETYFFRHPAQLELLRGPVWRELDAERRQAGRRMLTAWIAGCSTGEEAWTLALMAAEPDHRGHGQAPVPLSILATDLSEAALAIARDGVYQRLNGLDSFRAIPPWAAHHFAGARVLGHWHVPIRLRGDVRFQNHNLLDPPPLANADLVVCRNTLIYFDEAASRHAQANLSAALRTGGVLMLGPADALRLPPCFESIASEVATLYRKRGAS